MLGDGVADCMPGPERLSTQSISAVEGRRGTFSLAGLFLKLPDWLSARGSGLGRTQGKGLETSISLGCHAPRESRGPVCKGTPISGAD